jgi:glycine/D-amino acid oxidase-like deaminating enzyme
VSAPLSLWLKETEFAPWAAARTETVDVLVVGAGLAGLAVARALVANGRSVRVLDRGLPGHGASGRNAGFVLATHVTSYPAMRRAIGPERARALLSLAHRNGALVAEKYGAAAQHRRTGSLMLGVAGDASEKAVLTEARSMLLEDGVRTDWADVPSGLAGFDVALRIEDDAEVHPGRLVAALGSGVEGAMGEVLAIEDDVAILTTGERITFATAVLATNAWTSALAPQLKVSPQRAQMLSTTPAPIFLPAPCYAGFGYEYFRQRQDGRVLLGGLRAQFRTSEGTTDAKPTEAVQEAIESYLRAHLLGAKGTQIEHRWAGTMGFSEDGLPLLGELSPRVQVIGGFTGHGLGTALACAEVLGRSLCGTATAEDRALLSALAPTRTPATFGTH